METNWRTWRKRKDKKNKCRPPTREEVQYATDLYLFEGGKIDKQIEPEQSARLQKKVDARLYRHDEANAHQFLTGNYNILKSY
jgi:hypothetical protein